MDYPVRGAIATRAEEIKKELHDHPEKHSKFNEIVPVNIGNPQAVGQAPITFHRQVLSCLLNPALLELSSRSNGNGSKSCSELSRSSSTHSSYDLPDDVKRRAATYLSGLASFGAYSHSKGVALFRNKIAKWFESRDGFECNPESIFLTDGASSAIKQCLELLISSPTDGILIPIPQYPLYSATITRLDGRIAPYYLDEENEWAFTAAELKRAVESARSQGTNLKALVVINPGNPTGSVLKETDIRDIIETCGKENLVILADEVYQENIYDKNVKFASFRKVLKNIRSQVECISFHSSSKGLAGECGVRGGLMQLENISESAIAVLYKLSCVNLCSNTLGQAMITSILTPLSPEDPSYQLWNEERMLILNSLKRKASYAAEKFNNLQGVSCQKIVGAMYAFPRLTLPPKAISAAQSKNVQPDMLYCLELLEETGILCTPGSGFGQAPGTLHIRVTILPEEEIFQQMMESLSNFHDRFLYKYAQ